MTAQDYSAPLTALLNLDDVTARIRFAAERGDWDQVIELEPLRSDCFFKLEQFDLSSLPKDLHLDARTLLDRIKANTVETQKHIQPWLSHVAGLLRVNAMANSVTSAYKLNE